MSNIVIIPFGDYSSSAYLIYIKLKSSNEVDNLSYISYNTSVFSDGEISVTQTDSVRNKIVYICGSPLTSDEIITYIMLLDSLKRDGVKEIIAVMPYLPYMRQDRRGGSRTNVGAKVIAKLLEDNGVNHVITLDLHVAQIESFFNIMVSHFSSISIFDKLIQDNINKYGKNNLVLVAPDVGASKRVEAISNKYNIPMVISYKTRSEHNQVDNIEVLGNVLGKHCLIFDDMVDTGGSIIKVVERLSEMGAEPIVNAFITHPVLSTNRIFPANIKMNVTNSVTVNNESVNVVGIEDFMCEIILTNIKGIRSFREAVQSYENR